MEQEQPKPLTERSHHCVHTEEERCLTSTWPTPELQEAINRGYVIRHVYEVWHFPSNSNTMFSSYVNTFLKMKLELVYKQVDDEKSVQVNINILVACFTTCWSRLKLYRDRLCRVPPTQVLYFDMDSIIFSHRPGEAKPATGDHIGEFTSELKPGDHIVEFAAAGPKNYGYRTKDGKVECKVRGFTLNTSGQEQLSFELLKQNVIDEVTDPGDEPRAIPVHNPHKIRRDVNTKQLETVEETKQYKVVFDKRVIDPDTFQSYPYGYNRAGLDDTDMDNVQLLLDM